MLNWVSRSCELDSSRILSSGLQKVPNYEGQRRQPASTWSLFSVQSSTSAAETEETHRVCSSFVTEGMLIFGERHRHRATGEDITSVAMMHVMTQEQGEANGSDRSASRAGPLIAGSGWTPRRSFGLIKPSASHIPECVPQQPLAAPRLQTAALPEGQDFCLCRKKQIFTPNPHAPARSENKGQQRHGEGAALLEMLAETMFCEELKINCREELKCHLEQINSSTDTFESGIKAAASQQQSSSSSEMWSTYSWMTRPDASPQSGGLEEGCKCRPVLIKVLDGNSEAIKRCRWL